jgi:aryl carrier-like protein
MTLTVSQMVQDVAQLLGESPDDVPIDESLVDYGLDSIRLMTLAAQWRGEHGISVAFQDLAERPVIEVWACLLGSGE